MVWQKKKKKKNPGLKDRRAEVEKAHLIGSVNGAAHTMARQGTNFANCKV